MASGFARSRATATAASSVTSRSARVNADDVVRLGAFVRHGGGELAARSHDRNPHHAALDDPDTSNARIRSSSNTPSQRATTAVAMQLPITFTAVRPMSMI